MAMGMYNEVGSQRISSTVGEDWAIESLLGHRSFDS